MLKKKSKSMIHLAIKSLQFTVRCWPKAFILFVISGIVFGVMLGANAWIMQAVFDNVEQLIAGSTTFTVTVMIIIIFVFYRMILEIFTSLYYYFMNIIAARMHGFMSREIAIKSTKLDPILFEDPKILDDIEKASKATNQVYWVGNIFSTTTIFYLPFLLMTGVYLYLLNPWLVFVIFFIFVPKMAGIIVRGKLFTELEDTSAPLRRQVNFYEKSITDREFFKETRILGAFNFFKDKYLSRVNTLNVATWKAESKSARLDLVMSFLTVIGYLATLVLLVHTLEAGLISVGAFAAVFGSVSTLIWRINDLISFNLKNISEEIGKISNLMTFFELPEISGEKKSINWKSEIIFDNVTFTYPNAKKKSLDGINLTIKAGETIAIVGENGAGKSTLTNLLLGLYKPTEGQIRVGDTDLNTHNNRKKLSTVFQKFQKYQLSLAENVQMSDISKNEEFFDIMKQAGVEWESRSYPEGLDTVLSRAFDGIDLSGGQWQRIAIARGLYRIHDLIILDEPTAAIDPLEENRLYEKFAEISKGKTAIIVTHRLGSAQIADKIIVLDEGHISEIGTHEELLMQKGKYQMMYDAQASWYVG